MAKPKMTKLRKAARGQECQLRIPGVCCGDTETTVLCHVGGAGTGTKSHDLHASWGCYSCHQWIDGGYVKTSDKDTRDLYHLEGVIRTQVKLIEQGLIPL